MKQAWAAVTLALIALPDAARPTNPTHAAPTHAVMTQLAIDGYVLPKAAAFVTASRALAEAVTNVCATPGDTAKRENLNDTFTGALTAYAQTEVVRIGPATRDGRAQKIAFWPDPRGAVERQVRQALSEHRASLTSAATLTDESAALQGFPALELLLTDKDAGITANDDEGRFRCKAAAAIAENIANLAQEIAEGWTKAGGWRDLMLAPGPANAEYPTAEVAATDVFKSLTTSMQAMLEAQVRPLATDDHAKTKEPNGAKEPEKKTKAPAQPYRRLGLSRAYLLAGMSGTRDLYKAARLVEYFDMNDPDQKAYAQLIDMGMDKAIAQIDTKVWHSATSPEEEATRSRTAHVVISMFGGARRVIATKLAPAAGISLGFNELDGD